jgi:pyridoxal phosphate enzyme (YggS family)
MAVDTKLASRIETVLRQIDEAATLVGRDPATVTLVAVSKTVEWPAIEEAYDLGLRHFGENRVQSARARIPIDHPADLILHLIGQLQTNKAGHALDLFDVIESVDRPSIVAELNKQAARRDRVVPVLLQVNIAGEAQKAGCSIDEAKPLAQEIDQSANLRLDGLMTIAPLVEDAEVARPVFRGLRVLRDRLAADLGRDLRVLSMGMSNDYPVAVQEGATMVRVGRAIFAQ